MEEDEPESLFVLRPPSGSPRQRTCHSRVAPAAPWNHRRSARSHCGRDRDKSDFRQALFGDN